MLAIVLALLAGSSIQVHARISSVPCAFRHAPVEHQEAIRSKVTEILEKRRYYDTAPPIEKIVADGKEIVPDLLLGKSNAGVWLTRDRNLVAKIYENTELSRAMIDYEIWTTEYYNELGIPVAPIYGPPLHVTRPDGRNRLVLIKGYVPGARHDELHPSWIQSIEQLTGRNLMNELGQHIIRLRGLHKEDFVVWLRSKGYTRWLDHYDAQIRDGFLKFASASDAKPRNFVLTVESEWVSIDP